MNCENCGRGYVSVNASRPCPRCGHHPDEEEPAPDGEHDLMTDGGTTEIEKMPRCPECEVFALPTDAGECGACGSSITYREGRT